MITDTAQLVLTVKRCAVITRIAMYSPPPEEEEQPARRLFDDLVALISSSQAMKMSSAPSDFDETLLFNP